MPGATSSGDPRSPVTLKSTSPFKLSTSTSTRHLSWAMDFGSRTHGQMAAVDSDHDMSMHSRRPSAPVALGHRLSRRKDSMQHSHPKPPLTPNTSSMPQSMANPLLPSAPASPPTPAPSPTPHQRSPASWQLAMDETEDSTMEEARHIFSRLDITAKENWLRSLVEMCDNHSLSFLHQIVSPKLKKDPFKVLPNELCFRVCRDDVSSEHGNSLTPYRYSNSSMIPKRLSVPYKFQGGGAKSSAMTKLGRP